MIFTARMYHNLYNHYSIHVHPPCFQFVSITNIPAINWFYINLYRPMLLFLWAQFPGLGLLIKEYVYPIQETQEMQIQSLAQEDPLEEDMATHFSILAWRIPWTEKSGRLQSTGSQLSDTTEATLHTCAHLYIR